MDSLFVKPLLSPAQKEYVRTIAAAGHPIVVIGKEESLPSIALNNEQAIEQVVAHLVNHGHQEIAFYCWSSRNNRFGQ